MTIITGESWTESSSRRHNPWAMTHTRTFAGLMTVLFLPVLAGAQGANAKAAPGSPTADRLPIYEVDPSWPPTLPNDWILGDIRGLFVDDRDHLWVIHMPSSLTPQEIGAAVKPPIPQLHSCAACSEPPRGKVLRTGAFRVRAIHGSNRSMASQRP